MIRCLTFIQFLRKIVLRYFHEEVVIEVDVATNDTVVMNDCDLLNTYKESQWVCTQSLLRRSSQYEREK